MQLVQVRTHLLFCAGESVPVVGANGLRSRSVPISNDDQTQLRVMRLRVSINVTREVVRPLEVDGYLLKPGSVLQAPTEISHYDEAIWGADGHPAAEFWAERHVKYVDGAPVFEMRGRPTDFFPYGGGVAMCPGRHFAKQEIMLTIAMLATKFEYEFVGWVDIVSSRPSDRPPINDPKYAGAAGVPPDRDMKVRVKKLW